MNVLIIGGSGLIGTNLVRQFESHGHDVTGTYYESDGKLANTRLNKTNRESVETLVSDLDSDIIVDTAAFHEVDDCEINRDRAWAVNAEGTRNVAIAADSVGAHYIYISTDYVFPGVLSEAPYSECDCVAPINYYARTKYAGEQAARIADNWTIFRSGVVYGLTSDNFATWVLNELEAGNEIDIVDDQVSRPTYAPDVARACVTAGEQNITGLYHAAGPKSLSRYEFTLSLAEQFGFDSTLISSTTTEELGQYASRPTDSSLDSSKFYNMIDYQFREPAAAFEYMQ